MLTKYIEAAMRRAEYKWLADEGVFFGRTPDLRGAWATGVTREACAEELREVVEEWVMLGLSSGDVFPVIDGIELRLRSVA